MSHSASLILSVTAGCLISFLSTLVSTEARADEAEETTASALPSKIPAYFFKQWTVAKDCTEEHAGPEGHVQSGQKFQMTQARSADFGQSFGLKTLDAKNTLLSGIWANVKLEYRAGQKMTAVPAEYVCVPGEAASSPFLAMSNNSTIAEPWNMYEHWYALVTIHDEPHHLLIFPRDVTGEDAAIIVLQDAASGDSITLDHDGTITTNN